MYYFFARFCSVCVYVFCLTFLVRYCRFDLSLPLSLRVYALACVCVHSRIFSYFYTDSVNDILYVHSRCCEAERSCMVHHHTDTYPFIFSVFTHFQNFVLAFLIQSNICAYHASAHPSKISMRFKDKLLWRKVYAAQTTCEYILPTIHFYSYEASRQHFCPFMSDIVRCPSL